MRQRYNKANPSKEDIKTLTEDVVIQVQSDYQLRNRHVGAKEKFDGVATPNISSTHLNEGKKKEYDAERTTNRSIGKCPPKRICI